jgi:DNA repair protein RadC
MVLNLAILAQDLLIENVVSSASLLELGYVTDSSPAAGLAEPRLGFAALPSHLDIGRMGSMLGQVHSSLHDGSSETGTLQMLLELVLDEAPSALLAARLIDRFGSLGSVVSASAEALHAIAGVAAPVIALLKLVHHATFRIAHAEVKTRPVIGNWDKLIDYLTVSMAYEAVEQLRVLFLDNRNTLIADEVMGRGTVNFVNVHPREVVKRALALEATAIILVHNHPSGCSKPSRDDVTMTKDVQTALETLDITLHDHIIIGKGNYYSFRRNSLVPGSSRR